VRRVKRYIESAVEEATLMKKIHTFMDSHSEGHQYMIRLLDTFYQKSGHYCMVLDRCGPSLYDLVKKHKYVPLHVDTILSIGHQLMSSLAFLHDVCRCVHTDLKLENILFSDVNVDHLMDPQGGQGGVGKSSGSSRGGGGRVSTTASSMYVRNPRIRLIDFGGATFETDHHASIINTRQYRGPEVILSSGWSYPSDVWSAGCILFELAKGRLLFETHDNHEHLALMEEMLGPVPPAMARQHWQHSTKFFGSAVDRDGREYLKLRWPSPQSDCESVEHVSRMLPLPQLCAKYRVGQVLSSVLYRMLRMNPSERSTARQVVNQFSSFLTKCEMCGTKEKSMTRCEFCRKYFVCIGCRNTVGAPCGCGGTGSGKREESDHRTFR
jgi:serine/threonine protein kinase